MKTDEPTSYIQFPDGRELTRKEAEHADLVFCAYEREPNTVYAFDYEASPELIARWAQEHGIADAIAATDAEIAAQPERPSVERTAAAAAADLGAVPTVTLFQLQELLRTAATAQLTESTTDVKRKGLTDAARSAIVDGSIAVYFYREIDYGPPPARTRPVFRQLGSGLVRLIPHGAWSVYIKRM
jgi:hypothetical protein